MTEVIIEELQRWLTPQTGIQSVLTLQPEWDNPLMPIISTPLFNQKVEATFNQQHWKEQGESYLYTAPFPFSSCFFFPLFFFFFFFFPTQIYQLKYNHTAWSLLDCFAKGHSCLHNGTSWSWEVM